MRHSPFIVALFVVVLLSAAAAVRAADRGPDATTGGSTAAVSPVPIEVHVESRPAASTAPERTRMLADVGGLRPWLADHGLSLEITSVDEVLGAPRDDAPASDASGHYAGLTDVLLGIDTTAAGWWQGGTIEVVLQNARGDDVSETVGDVQGVSSIAGPPGTRFAEYHLTQQLAGGRALVKVGKQDANADFVVSDGGGEFVNSSFGLVPTVPLPTYPAPALGAMAAWRTTGAVLLKTGVWDGAAEVGSGCTSTVLDGQGGTVAAVEAELSAGGGRRPPGTYRLGVWHHSEVELPGTAKSHDADTGTVAADGLYLTVDQALWRRDGRSVALFAQAGWSEADHSELSRYLGGGLVAGGLLTGRPNDVVGVGVAHATIGERGRAEPDCDRETVVELFYRLPVSGWMQLQPDVQWVHRPGGRAGDSAWVAGLRVVTTF